MARKLIPQFATLVMGVFDVDSGGCSENFKVFLNSTEIGSLSGNEQSWRTVRIPFDTRLLKFRVGGAPTVQQDVFVQLDSTTCSGNPKKVRVDWIHIETSPTIHPVLLIHGWNGNASGWQIFNELAGRLGLLINAEDYAQGLEPISTTAQLGKTQYVDMTQRWGVKRVNIIGHSKGGIIAREMQKDPSYLGAIDHIITIGSPHHGVLNDIQLVGTLACAGLSGGDLARCITATAELTQDNIRRYMNYTCDEMSADGILIVLKSTCKKIWIKANQTTYASYASNLAAPLESGDGIVPYASSTFPWRADDYPYPAHAAVDRTYSGYFHSGFQAQRVVICDALRDMYTILGADCDALPQQVLQRSSETGGMVDAVVYPGSTDTLFSKLDFQLAPGESREIYFPLADPTSPAAINLYSDAPVFFGLIDPAGNRIGTRTLDQHPSIDYAVDDAAGMNGDLILQQYRVMSPAIGYWRAVITASQPTTLTFFGFAKPPARLVVGQGASSHLAGSPITVTAFLTQAGAVLPGTVITAHLTYQDGTSTAVTFADAGRPGDMTSGDGRLGALLIAPTTSTLSFLSVVATNGLIAQSALVPIYIRPQTGRLIGIAGERLVDEDGNGLANRLEITASVYISQAGAFEIVGTLEALDGTYINAAHARVSLAAGMHSILLAWRGNDFVVANKPGPYVMPVLQLRDTSFQFFEVETRRNVFTTTHYLVSQFE